MSAQLDIAGTAQIETAIKQFPGRFLPKAETTMRAFGQEYIRRLATERLAGRPGLNRRTGNLARSFRSRSMASAALGAVVLDVSPEGVGARYANLQEKGGTVRPVKAKYLWIPIAGNLTGAGVARITPTEAINRGGFIRGGVFFGQPLIKRGGAAPVPLFALKKSVTIPARMGAVPLWTTMVGSTLTPALDRVAGRVLGGNA